MITTEKNFTTDSFTQPGQDGNAEPLFRLTVLCKRSEYRMGVISFWLEQLVVTEPGSTSAWKVQRCDLRKEWYKCAQLAKAPHHSVHPPLLFWKQCCYAQVIHISVCYTYTRRCLWFRNARGKHPLRRLYGGLVWFHVNNQSWRIEGWSLLQDLCVKRASVSLHLTATYTFIGKVVLLVQISSFILSLHTVPSEV